MLYKISYKEERDVLESNTKKELCRPHGGSRRDGRSGRHRSGRQRGSKVTLVFTSQYNGNNGLDNWITAAAKVFEKTHPNVTVAIRNIVTNSESTYYAKLDLAERSSSTTPDISYEDSFLVQSDAAAGYIRALPQLTSDPEWKNQYPVFHSMTEYNGVPYGMMIETDVQQLYYDMALFKKAGLPTNWQPKTWADIITAAKAIKAHDPGVTPAVDLHGHSHG